MKYSSRRVREYCRSNAGPNLSPLEVSRYEFKLRPMSIGVHFSPALENSLGTDKGQAESKMDTSSTHVATWLLNKRTCACNKFASEVTFAIIDLTYKTQRKHLFVPNQLNLGGGDKQPSERNTSPLRILNPFLKICHQLQTERYLYVEQN